MSEREAPNIISLYLDHICVIHVSPTRVRVNFSPRLGSVLWLRRRRVVLRKKARLQAGAVLPSASE